MNTTIADIKPSPISRATPESERAAKLELVSSILKRRQAAGEAVDGDEFSELMDLSTDDLFALEVRDCDRIYNKLRPFVNKLA